MTERIDHAAKALKIMHDVGTDERGEIPLELFDSHEQWIYEATMREAQVHATLALVEQQRIANLLTMAQFDHAIEDGVRLYTDLEWSAKLRQEAGERLGLS
ncbi:hypothetical protein [Microbacterium sp. K5D]|uniref:hypothetical protein n=1 Tax=Microbacterium sp. K5D TaxID=2305436 RepID=UPI00109C3393|nr:hypothetical protein [Microbacterium sp. K5D]